jgi:hypothetical protein
MSEAEPIFYLRDSDDSDDEAGRCGRAARATAVASRGDQPAARHRRTNSSSKAALARSVWEVEDRCAAAGERSGARRRAARIAGEQIDLARRQSAHARRRLVAHLVASTGIGAGATPVPPLSLLLLLPLPISTITYANPRPRSQYEHAPRRDHAFNRQRLPPPPPPIGQQRCCDAAQCSRLLLQRRRCWRWLLATTPVPRFPPRPLTTTPISRLVSVRFSPTLIDLLARIWRGLADAAADNDVDVRDNDVDDQHEDEFQALRSRVMLERDLLSQMPGWL